MLIGKYVNSIDAKGRVFFPAKLREDMGDSFVVTRGLDGCLYAYSVDEWKRLEDAINAMPKTKSRDVARYFFSNAIQVETDKQGRILISSELREHAGLSKDVVFLGVSSKVEIWDLEKWEKICSNISDESVADVMEELGF